MSEHFISPAMLAADSSTTVSSEAGALDDHYRLLQSAELADVEFLVGDDPPVSIFAHRLILCARCEYYKQELTGLLREGTASGPVRIPVPDMSASVFRAVLRWLYTGRLLPKDEARDADMAGILKAADKLQIESLKLACQRQLFGNLSVSNVADMWLLARDSNSLHLQSQAFVYMLERFSDVQRSTAFANACVAEPSLALQLLSALDSPVEANKRRRVSA